MNEWELKRVDILRLAKQYYEQGGRASTLEETEDMALYIATAAVKKYRAHLASQCGPDPCVGCEWKMKLNRPDWCDDRCPYKGNCTKEARYQGQQAGLAQAEPLVKKREQEIVEWLKSKESDDDFIVPCFREVRQALVEWLKGEGNG